MSKADTLDTNATFYPEEESYPIREIKIPGLQIIIRYQCSICGRVRGRVVTNGKKDRQDIFYKRSFVAFEPEDTECLPTSICNNCQHENHE